MKLVIEALVAIVLHPIALVLSWINIASRSDLSGGEKLLWAVLCLIWGIGPLLYVLIDGGRFW